MSKYWEMEILTSCAHDYVTWDNHYAPGTEQLDSVVIRRFPVAAPRATEAFNQLSAELHAKIASCSEHEQEAWMRAQGPWCPDLAKYIAANATRYDAFVFFTYLYWHTFAALPPVKDRAILVPLAHDEWTIYLPIFRRVFEQVRRFIFNTVEERDFLRRLFDGLRFDGPIVGVAVDRPKDVDPLRFRRQREIQEDFLLYIGRIDPSKACQDMFDNFLTGRREGALPRKLVLLGKAVMPVPQHEDLLSFGFVSEQEKWDALAGCQALVMPSAHESLSMVLLEAWSVGRPAIVNGRCEVLVGQCMRSNGGLWYTSYHEWLRCLMHINAGRTASVLGRQGWRFMRDHYSWPTIERAYLEEVEALCKDRDQDAMEQAGQVCYRGFDRDSGLGAGK